MKRWGIIIMICILSQELCLAQTAGGVVRRKENYTQKNSKGGNSTKPQIPSKIITFQDPSGFSEGLASIKINGKHGYIDKSGLLVIPCKYELASLFEDSLACVELNGKYGFINSKGREVIPCKYDDAYSFFREGLVWKMPQGQESDTRWKMSDV